MRGHLSDLDLTEWIQTDRYRATGVTMGDAKMHRAEFAELKPFRNKSSYGDCGMENGDDRGT